MKLANDFILNANLYSKTDADFRYEEFKTFKALRPKKERYPIEKMQEVWIDCTYFQIKNIEGLYGELDGKLLIIFRGTDSLFDWWRNTLLFKKTVPYKSDGTNRKIKVHGGMLKSYMTVRDFILDVVKKSEYKEVVFHGHSKGGALSYLAALDVQYNLKEKDVKVFTIGPPRIGNKHFANSFNRRLPDTFWYNHGNDLVPQLLPKFLGFEHVGVDFQLGKERDRKIGTFKDHNWQLYYDALYDRLRNQPD